MRKFVKIGGIVLGLALLALAWPAWQLYGELAKARSEDPLVWEADIQALEAGSAGRFAPGEAVVFIGSSSIRLWRTLAEDMAPVPVLQHGFGGAKLNDAVHYADRLVSAFRPRAVVLFAGSNDIHPGATKSPQALLDGYREFVARVRREQPALPVFFIAITPSPLRWEVWHVAVETNELIRAWSDTQTGLYFIDTGPALLDSSGEPDPDNYLFDGLHLNARGYAIWTSIIRPRLLAELDVTE